MKASQKEWEKCYLELHSETRNKKIKWQERSFIKSLPQPFPSTPTAAVDVV